MGLAYSRTGSLFVNANGDLVINSSDGYKLEPNINVPANATNPTITSDGRVYVNVPSQTDQQQIGQMQLATFINPEGLSQIGGNLYQTTQASGQPVLANPGTDKSGTLQQDFSGSEQRRSGE